jgi:integrase
MSNRIRRRGKNSWEIQLELARDSSGKRQRRFYSCKGTRKDAERKMVALLASIDKGDYIDKTRRTIAEHLAERIEVWSTAKKISPKTRERYLELARNQINPHIGALELQKLKSQNIEAWHNTLRLSGRKDGNGGVSDLTIRHAHRLLAKGLRDAARHNLVGQNAASIQGAPSVDRVEMKILTHDQVAALPTLLAGHKLFPRAMVALFAGLRRGELLGLRWNRINLDAGSLKVEASVEVTKAGLREKQPKTTAGKRELMLPADLIEILREHYRAQLEWSLKLGQVGRRATHWCFRATMIRPRSIVRAR